MFRYREYLSLHPVQIFIIGPTFRYICATLKTELSHLRWQSSPSPAVKVFGEEGLFISYEIMLTVF